MNTYWSKGTNQRLSRRKLLGTTATGAGAALLLAACGGGGSDQAPSGTANGDASKLLAKIEDTSKSAKRDGAYRWVQTRDPLHFDGQAQGQVQLNTYNGMVYESLVRNKPGLGKTSTWTGVLPNLAESWEESPDHLTITFKVRQGVKWQDVAPVSGRAFEASDVVESFERFAKLPNNNRASSVNSVNPSAPILSVTALDSKTVVYKLKEPASYLMQRLASMITGEIGGIYPKETDNGFDPRKGQIGTGGFMLDRYTPSASINYKRNPTYWNKDGPYSIALEVPIIASYPTQLAQFETGAIYSIPGAGAGPGVQPQDILRLKHDHPEMQMVQLTPASNSPGFINGFGWNDLDGKKAPWLDIRVRRRCLWRWTAMLTSPPSITWTSSRAQACRSKCTTTPRWDRFPV